MRIRPRVLSSRFLRGLALALLMSPLLSTPLWRPPLASAEEPAEGLPAQARPQLPIASARLLADTAPSIAVTLAEGYSGQRVRGTGQAPAGAAGVRLVWRYSGATRSAALVTLDAGRNYYAVLSVPHDAPAGPAEVCAAITGVERAVFGCAPFTVLPAPPGAVAGRLPASVEPTVGETGFRLLDPAGATLQEAPLAPDGSFRLDSVAPGSYKTAIIGPLSQMVVTSAAVVRPAQTTTVEVRLAPHMSSCSSRLAVTQVNLSPSASHSAASEPNGDGLGDFPPAARASSSYDFGVYIAGVSLPATLNVTTAGKPEGIVAKERAPTYRFVSPDGKSGPSGTMTSASKEQHWQAQIDLGLITSAGVWELHVTPQDSSHSSDFYCQTVNHARIIDDPMKKPLVFQPNSSKTTWNSSKNWYEFHGWIPNLLGLLPLRYPQSSWTLPLLGDATSEFDAGLSIQGTMTLDCTMTFSAFDLEAKAKVLGFSVMDKTYTPSITPQHFNPDDPRSLSINLPSVTLWEGDWSTQVYEGVIATYWGIVSVKAAVSVGLQGSIIMTMRLQPLQPAVDIELDPRIVPYLTTKLWVDLLLGVASAGADATASVSVTLPFHINPSEERKAWFEKPCAGFRLDLSVWARVNLGFWKKKWDSEPFTLVDKNSCGQVNPAPTKPPTPPKLLGAPAIAASPDGGMLVVFVGDSDPGGQSPKPKVYALYKAPGASGWPSPDRAVALTDGTKMVQDPTVAFALKSNKAFVFWTQTNISSSDEDRAGDDINKILDHQDIYMRAGFPEKNQWDSIQPVTDDPSNNLYADGRPAAAGDDLGLSLVWVRAETSPYDRKHTRIVMRNLDETGWGTTRQLPDSDNGMHTQPSVVRAHFYNGFGREGWRAVRFVAYTTNADLSAPGPRRIRVWFQDGWKRDSDLVDWTGTGLPDHAVSPALGLDYQGGPMLAYLLGATNPEGAPPADPTALLYFAQVDGWPGSYHWHPSQMKHNDGSPIKAERLSFAWRPNSKSVDLIFREFGAAGTDTQVGHIAKIYFLYSEFQTEPYSISHSGFFRQGPGANWQPAAATNHTSRELEVCWLESAPQSEAEVAALAQLRPASPAARMAATAVTLDTSVEALKMVTVPPKGDSALDPALVMAPRHAAVGETVTITTTVRNLGREPVSNLIVSLFHDDSGALSRVGTAAITDTLLPGGAVQVAWDVVAESGQQFYHAIVSGGESDIGDLNNHASGVLNTLGRPRLLTVVPSQRFADALEIGWEMEGRAAVAGYRILRATAIEGPYELVGEATSTTFVDLGLSRVVRCFYKVQAYDANGILSPASAPMSGRLPAVRRRLPATS